jgi:hypothetical protein
MTPSETARFVAGLMSLAVYFLVAWPISGLIGTSVWSVLGWLIAIRAFFGVVEGLAGILNWRLFGRGRAVAAYLSCLRDNNFPPRMDQGDALHYLAIVSSDIGSCSADVRRLASELVRTIELAEEQRILAGMRMNKALEIALEKHSPKAQAPLERN